MSIDLTAEKPLPLKDACHLIPPGRNGRRTHLSTVLRWVIRGVRATGGSVVRLEAVRLGGRWVTSREAIQRFAERLTPCLDDGDAAPALAPRTPRQRRKAADKAGDELAKMGI
jgi:Protein of unknown function (DUF1580)